MSRLKTFERLLPFAFIFLSLGLLALLTQNQFVDYDDRQFIFDNAEVLHFDLQKIWTTLEHASYFPLAQMTFALENKFLGIDPWHFHLFNGLLHILTALVVRYLILLLSPTSKKWAWLSAIIFLIHPMNVEAFAWANQRRHLFSSLFFLIGLVAWIHRDQTTNHRKRNLLLATVYALFLLSCVSKVTGIMLPLILLSYDLYRRRPLFKTVRDIFPMCMGSLAFAYVQIRAEDRLSANPSTSLGEILRNTGEALTFYVSKFLAPIQMRIFYESSALTVLNYLLAVLFLVFLVFQYRRRPQNRGFLIFGILFFLVTLIPMIKFVPFGSDSVWNDRYLYLPMVGFLLALTDVARAKYWNILFVCLIALGCWQSTKQIRIWSQSARIWENTLLYHPLNSTAHQNLGTIRIANGQYAEGIEHLKFALKSSPRNIDLLMNLAVAYNMNGEEELSVQTYQALFQKGIVNGILLSNYSSLLLKLGRLEDAETALNQALKFSDVPPQAYSNFGLLYLAQRNLPRAKISFQKYLQLSGQAQLDPEISNALEKLEKKKP